MSLNITRPLMIAAAFAVSLGVMSSVQAGPLGNAFVVNSYVPGNQHLSSASAAAGNGDKIFLWNDSNRSATFVQRYNVAGQPLSTGEVYVGNTAKYVAADRVGNYAITSVSPDGSGEGVFVTMYDRSGNIRVNTFRVNDNTVGNQRGGFIGMNANGNFAVTYISDEAGQWNTYVKQYAATGAPRGPAVRINATNQTMHSMGIAIDSANNVVLSGWTMQGGAPDVWLRRVSPSGVLLGSQITVNPYTAGTQSGGHVAMDSSNNFIVAWQSYGQDGNGWSVYGQRFNPDGTRFGSPFRISQTLSESEPCVQIGMMDDGSFAATWYLDNRYGNPNYVPTVYARQFSANLVPVGNESIVNNIAGSKAFLPAIAMDQAGNYAIGWRDYAASGQYDVAARRYVMDTLPPITALNNGQTVTNISGAAGSWRYFKINIPAGTRTLNVNMSGIASGDGDLYIRFGALPTLTKWDIRPYLAGNNESVSITNPPAGDFYIGIYGYSAYPSISLTAGYN